MTLRKQSDLNCTKNSWHGREAYLLENDLIRLVCLTGGGHVSEFRFREGLNLPTLSPLWIPPWKTIEPFHYRENAHASQYGPPVTGRMISGIAGHSICLDYFGAPSQEEVEQGLSTHGEAPSSRWGKTEAARDGRKGSLDSCRPPAGRRSSL